MDVSPKEKTGIGNDKVVGSRGCCPDLRVQRKDDFEKVVAEKVYRESKAGECSRYRRFIHKRAKKIVGKAILEKGAEELQAINKGYPKDFISYDTYDTRRERDYAGRIKSVLERRIKR